ncbi:low affinity immunoglobulin epsilon Fc receptor-like [Ruditapes philippinarum]|uniref:low affinity immunoglobulin epsilon Fc receptor-like n=1 Tax=Ruditapes philippinarum TaxID=129788 RepID=UPI00295BDDDE|nr:low affinity immunoglobulin epsilon Fc receptor-like [Ruditapes philippinarum]
MFHLGCFTLVFIVTASVNCSNYERLKHRVNNLEEQLFHNSKEFREDIALLNLKYNTSYADLKESLPQLEERKSQDNTGKNCHDEVHDSLVFMKRTLSEEKSIARRSISKLETKVMNNLSQIIVMFNDIKNETRLEQKNVENTEETCNLKIDKITEEIMRMSEMLSRHVEAQRILSQSLWHIFGNSFYFIGKESLNWSQTIDTCKALDAYLVQIEDSNESKFITDLVKPTFAESNGFGVWIGGSDLQNEGSWIWEHSKARIVFSNWGPNEPNGNKRENCLHLYKSKGWAWNDAGCHAKMGFVCEK